jgi:hypothetical protein
MEGFNVADRAWPPWYLDWIVQSSVVDDSMDVLWLTDVTLSIL